MSKSESDKVANVQEMFSEVITFFNQDLFKWNVNELANMEMMFSEATSSFEHVLRDQ